ncbi:MAG: trypsin-like peptidase domain-containing protein [Limisphaerales bacterium]|jgi:serine protease Do|nr:trypsin-like peptidase domain-containing protein [Verrucomicrobiota bacterium]
MKKNWIKFCSVVLLSGWLAGSAAALAASGPAETDVRRDAVVLAVEKVMPSVVNISTETIVQRRSPFDDLWRDFFGPYYGRSRSQVRYSLGSGVIIDEEGYILTNLHVVQQATRIWVSLPDGRKLEAESVSDLRHSDVALLKIKAENGERFTAVTFAREDDLYLGETVIALGNPFGLGGSVTRGILSSKNRRPPVEGAEMDLQDWLQIDAAINPGNSGGPLINLAGELIGLNVAVYSKGDGIGFAIPIRAVSEALSLMLTPESVGNLWFGAVMESREGVLFKSVETGSPAEKAGIQPGDILESVNSAPVTGLIDATRQILKAGEKSKPVSLQIKRDQQTRRVMVTLAPESDYFNEEYLQKRLGMKLEKLTPELAETLGVQMMEAFAVMEVQSGSSADKVGIRPGMLIYGFDGEPIYSIVPLARALYKKPKDQKARLSINIQRKAGHFIESRNVEVEVALE